MKSLVSSCLCLGILVSPSLVIAEQNENALHAKCQINVRLIQADHGNSKKKGAEKTPLSTDENQQLESLPFGSYNTVDMKTEETSSFTPVNFKLASGSKESFTVSVTPHSLADNKVHYTLEWSTPKEKSVVATRLGVENGRSVMIGASLSSELEKKKAKDSRCYIIGVKVTCHG